MGATYDGNGNLATYNGWSYTYDSMNRLTTVTNGTTSANFFYDGLNRQVLRSVGGVGNFYPVWDGWDMYTEYTTGNAWSRNTIHGAPGDLVTQSKSGVTTAYYFPDGLGSTTYLGSGAGALLEQYTYDAHGTPTFYNAGGSVISASAYSVDHLFTGRQWYPTLGFYDLRNRAYLPSIGRFLQPDPIGFSGDPANLYRYCGNNPVNLSDPTGTTIVPGEGIADYWAQANGYLWGSETYRQIAGQLMFSSTTYTIEWTYSRISSFDPATNTIYWNPISANYTGLGGTQTPALAVAHEMGHAYQSETCPEESGDLETDDIANIETPIANELPEAVRTDHNDYGDRSVWLPTDGAAPNHIAADFGENLITNFFDSLFDIIRNNPAIAAPDIEPAFGEAHLPAPSLDTIRQP